MKRIWISVLCVRMKQVIPTVRGVCTKPSVAEGEGTVRSGLKYPSFIRLMEAISACTVIMATGCLSATAYAPVRTCLFRHLLTQVGLVCYSDRAVLWGEVVKIEAVGVHTHQELDCTDESPRLTDVPSAEVIKNVIVQGITGLFLPQVDEGDALLDAQGYILLPASLPVGTD